MIKIFNHRKQQVKKPDGIAVDGDIIYSVASTKYKPDEMAMSRTRLVGQGQFHNCGSGSNADAGAARICADSLSTGEK